jgi:uncharacterized protein YggE
VTLSSPLALAAALALAQVPPPQPQPASPPRTIHVSGEGRAFASPDVARVTIGVEAQDKASLARAAGEAAARMKKVLSALEKGGVAPKDVRTVRHDVEVQRSYDRSSGVPAGAITGYKVETQVSVTVRDIGKLGALLDQVVAAGSNSIVGLVLQKDDTSVEEARALEAAVADARAKAAVLAKAAGVTLGEVLQLGEGGRVPVPVMDGFVATRASREVPIATGQLEIAATVDVTYGIR